MKKLESVLGVLVFALIVGLLATVAIMSLREAAASKEQPSGIWAGLVDDLPSGRAVECVFARDPGGAVALTCDWDNAVRTR